ncbi:hypothetical protein L3X38_023385 [Prunus dulcis]|uniref:Uncharacterized protein n=1 Tax=Prunus dulcis TaxID=3755 RepID=A0AAD4VXW1_PRUDU|nr:hypothetical protein L3X38_023385 [Prunus dulcis]
MHGSWTFLFPFPFRKERVRGKDSDTSVTYRLVREYCGIEVDVDKLENAFTGTSPGSRLFGFIGATLGQRFGSLFAIFSSRTFLQGDPFLGIFRTLDLSSPLLVTMMVRFLYAKENLQGIQKHRSTMMCHAQFCFGEDGRVPM